MRFFMTIDFALVHNGIFYSYYSIIKIEYCNYLYMSV